MHRRLSRTLTTLALLLTALAVALGGVGHTGTARAAAGTVIILADSADGGMESDEALAAMALGYTVVLASDEEWAALTTAQFAQYSAIIIGDDGCDAAEANSATWAAAATGAVILIGSDPSDHAASYPGAARLIKQGIAFAASEAGKTGAYVTTDCINVGEEPESVALLSGFGTILLTDTNENNQAHRIASAPALNTLTDAELSNWSSSIHEVFASYPASFTPIALAVNNGAYEITAPDGVKGAPYIIGRGGSLRLTTPTTTTAVSGTYRAVSPTSLTLTATVRTKAGQPVDNGELVTFTLNGQTFQATTVNGVATVTLPGYKLASYGDSTVVKASYAGGNGYLPSQGTGKLTIVRR